MNQKYQDKSVGINASRKLLIFFCLLLGIGIGVWSESGSRPELQPHHVLEQNTSTIERTVEPQYGKTTGSRRIEQGRLVYLSHCVRCHGANGEGDGPEIANLPAESPRPRNFRDADWKFEATPESIESVLRQGIGGTSMAAFGSTLGETDLNNVVAYVASLAPPDARIPIANGQREMVRELVNNHGWQWSSDQVDQSSNIISTENTTNTISLQDWVKSKNKPETNLYFIQVWGVNCAICLEKLPEMPAMKQAVEGRGFGFSLLCADQPDANAVELFLKSQALQMTSLTDSQQAFQLATDLTLLPTTLLMNRQGQIIARKTGLFNWKNLP